MGTASRRIMCSALYVYNADLSYSRIFNQTRTVAIAYIEDFKDPFLPSKISFYAHVRILFRI